MYSPPRRDSVKKSRYARKIHAQPSMMNGPVGVVVVEVPGVTLEAPLTAMVTSSETACRIFLTNEVKPLTPIGIEVSVAPLLMVQDGVGDGAKRRSRVAKKVTAAKPPHKKS